MTDLDALDRQCAEALRWKWPSPTPSYSEDIVDHTERGLGLRIKGHVPDSFSPTRIPAQAMALPEMMPVGTRLVRFPLGWLILSVDGNFEHEGDTPCIAITRASVAWMEVSKTDG